MKLLILILGIIQKKIYQFNPVILKKTGYKNWVTLENSKRGKFSF